jgi:hypothetical protein
VATQLVASQEGLSSVSKYIYIYMRGKIMSRTLVLIPVSCSRSPRGPALGSCTEDRLSLLRYFVILLIPSS